MDPRRAFEDDELAKLFAAPLFTKPAAWEFDGTVAFTTMFWIILIAGTTGARLEEIGQAALADVKRDGTMRYLDITEYVDPDTNDDDGGGDGENELTKSVKSYNSVRFVPIHEKLIALGFDAYCDALRAANETQLFPELRTNMNGKRTKEASRFAGRLIDRFVTKDPRIVLHSLRHAFKAKGNDAGITDKTLDQICGHAPIHIGGRYGSRPRVKTLHRELHRIDFSCIDWSAIEQSFVDFDWAKALALARRPITQTKC